MTPDEAIQRLQRQIDALGDVTDHNIVGWRHQTIGIVEHIFGNESWQAQTLRHAKATRSLSKLQQSNRGVLADRRQNLNTAGLRSVLLAFIEEIRDFGLPALDGNGGMQRAEGRHLREGAPQNTLPGGSEMYRRVGVMIGSPGDADEERQAITDSILRWNAAHSQEKGIMLEPVKWETHATPGLRGRPQGMINEELIPISDCLIAVFRTRAGSPTGKEISGTIEEIREFMQVGKYVAVYFYEGQAAVSAIDPDQLKAVRDFKREIQQRGLTDSYQTVSELSAHLAHHLTAIVRAVTTQSPDPHRQPATAASASLLPLDTPLDSLPDAAIKEETEIVVNESRSWALLDTQFYQTETVRQTGGGDWVVEIRSNTTQEDAHLGGLQPQHYGRSRPIPFAHRNDGFLVTVKSVESVSQSGQQLWTITLIPENIEYGGSIMDVTWQADGRTYKPEDFARLRAGRILLNDPPPLKDDERPVSPDQMHKLMLESHIRGNSNPVSVEHCIVQVIYRSVGGDPQKFLRLARLASIYFLKAGGAVERVLDLTLGPIKQGHVHVRFRGQRRRVASNVAPAVIELEGECPLS